jgi:hypothetical protein
MNEVEQVWRERIDWVQASGLTIAEASAEPRVSVASGNSALKTRSSSGLPARTGGDSHSPTAFTSEYSAQLNFLRRLLL